MRTILLTIALLTLPSAALAGPIERACLQSDRSAATRSLCGCIQSVANATLNSRDQRRGARFFADPELAQKVRRSDTRRDDAFWAEWTDFAAAATRTCG